MEFVKPAEPTPEHDVFANVLLYGPPKTGKTAGAATAPGAILYLNANLPNATLFARRRDREGRISEVRPDSLDLLHEVGNASMQNPTWDTVVIDEVGELHRRLLDEASNVAIRPTLHQYGDVSTHVERFCRFMCEAPVNFVMVAHELLIDNEATGEVDYVPFTGTKAGSAVLGQKLMGMADIVGYTGIVEQEDGGRKYMAQLVTESGRRGGDRFNVLGDFHEVNLTEWFQLAGVHLGEPQAVETKQAA